MGVCWIGHLLVFLRGWDWRDVLVSIVYCSTRWGMRRKNAKAISILLDFAYLIVICLLYLDVL
jgi:hypothetical protein